MADERDNNEIQERTDQHVMRGHLKDIKESRAEDPVSQGSEKESHVIQKDRD